MKQKRMQILNRNAAVHVREGGKEDSRTIEGYAVVFGQESASFYEDADERIVEVVAPEAISSDTLARSDIKMTMFHDSHLLLARSDKGSGTLRYEIDAHGVKFSFEAPHTVDGDKALELVRRGDIKGCSFAFTTDYGSAQAVERSTEDKDGKRVTTYTIRQIDELFDFTLTDNPAYPTTSVSARELERQRLEAEQEESRKRAEQIKEQAAEMRSAARFPK